MEILSETSKSVSVLDLQGTTVSDHLRDESLVAKEILNNIISEDIKGPLSTRKLNRFLKDARVPDISRVQARSKVLKSKMVQSIKDEYYGDSLANAALIGRMNEKNLRLLAKSQKSSRSVETKYKVLLNKCSSSEKHPLPTTSFSPRGVYSNTIQLTDKNIPDFTYDINKTHAASIPYLPPSSGRRPATAGMLGRPPLLPKSPRRSARPATPSYMLDRRTSFDPHINSLVNDELKESSLTLSQVGIATKTLKGHRRFEESSYRNSYSVISPSSQTLTNILPGFFDEKSSIQTKSPRTFVAAVPTVYLHSLHTSFERKHDDLSLYSEQSR